MASITDLIGPLTRDGRIDRGAGTSPREVPPLPRKALAFVIDGLDGDPSPDDFAAAVGAFMKLTWKDRELASREVFENYLDIVHAFAPDDIGVEIERAEDVWEHVTPS